MCGHISKVRTSFRIAWDTLPVITDLQKVVAFAATASDRNVGCARIDAILDQFRHGLKRIRLGQGDDCDCVPVVADAQFTAFGCAIRRCWFFRHKAEVYSVLENRARYSANRNKRFLLKPVISLNIPISSKLLARVLAEA